MAMRCSCGVSRARLALAALLAACSGAAAAGQQAATAHHVRASGNATGRAAAPARASPATSVPPPAAGPAPLLPLSATQILTHVQQTIAWYRELETIEQLPLPGVGRGARERLEQQALTAAQLAFQFGYASAVIRKREQPVAAASGKTPQPPAATLAAQLDQESASLAARKAALSSRLAALDARLVHVRASQARTALLARRAALVAALDLIGQIGSNLAQMRRFQASTLAGPHEPAGVRGKLAELERSLPELEGAGPGRAAARRPAPSGVTGRGSRSAPVSFRPQAAGIVGLISRGFVLHGADMQLDRALTQTSGLESELQGVRARILGRVRNRLRAALGAIGTMRAGALVGERGQIETTTRELRELSSVLVPLGEQELTVASAHGILDGWLNAVDAQESAVASYLGLRVGFVLAWIAVVLVISEIWRRATFRYLQDARRRRPFLVLRRLVIGITLAVVVIFGLVSQVGSIATYAGFVTAGLAVALQNVLLAVVGYFFLIGRYGVRVGDRISIANVTGRVVDLSLLRMYLLELAGPELHATGRMVVFSNAVLFQPSALFKQVPGADYFWHSVTLTIASTADVDEAHRRLEAAARRIYATYRSAIDNQHAHAQRFIEFETAAPEPEVRSRLSDQGLVCEVRYPVVSPEKSARIDQQMLAALREALEHDQQFQLVASAGVALKTAL